VTTVIDDAVVGAILLMSILYAVYALGPKALRQRLLSYGGWVLPGGLGRRLRAAAQVKAGGACGGCESCGSNAATDGEVGIPVSRIGKRNVRGNRQ